MPAKPQSIIKQWYCCSRRKYQKQSAKQWANHARPRMMFHVLVCIDYVLLYCFLTCRPVVAAMPLAWHSCLGRTEDKLSYLHKKYSLRCNTRLLLQGFPNSVGGCLKDTQRISTQGFTGSPAPFRKTHSISVQGFSIYHYIPILRGAPRPNIPRNPRIVRYNSG